MSCCKAEEFDGWCSELDTTEWNGKEYCVFHAPADHPEKQNIASFNNLVYDKIHRDRAQNLPINLSGTIFPGTISFSRYGSRNPLPKSNFSYAQFLGNAQFNNVSIEGDARLNNAIFFKNVNFMGAAIHGNLYLDHVQINGRGRFSRATISKNLYFFEAHVEDDLDFNYARLEERANFSNTTFRKRATFENTFFGYYARFSNAHFEHSANFFNCQFSSIADFTSAHFLGEAQFRRSEFGGGAYFINGCFLKDVNFNRASFRGIAFFHNLTLPDIVDFSGASFLTSSFFQDMDFRRASFSGCQFEKPAFFRSNSFKSASFNGCFINHYLEFDHVDMRRVSLLRLQIEKIRFIACAWPRSRGRRVCYDARKVHGKGYFKLETKEILESWYEGEPPSENLLADVFRRLKKIALSEQDYPLASDWHFAEKDMFRRHIINRLKSSVRPLSVRDIIRHITTWLSYEVYRGSSGYGERPLRALLLLLVFICLPLLPWYDSPFSHEPASFLPLVKAKTLDEISTWGYVGRGAWQLLITVQAGLFALAVRNRMRR